MKLKEFGLGGTNASATALRNLDLPKLSSDLFDFDSKTCLSKVPPKLFQIKEETTIKLFIKQSKRSALSA